MTFFGEAWIKSHGINQFVHCYFTRYTHVSFMRQNILGVRDADQIYLYLKTACQGHDCS